MLERVSEERTDGPVGPVVAASVPPREAELLQLQRTAGNRAVGSLLRAQRHPGRRLARYEAGEHVQFEPSGANVPLAGISGVDLSYVIAAGDFYKDPDAFMSAKADELKELMALIDRDRAGLAGKGKRPTEDEWQKWSEKWRPKNDQYMELNKRNESHFAPRNETRWKDIHVRALKEAQSSGDGSGVVSAKAKILNAFAAHYLTDAFAAGHMIDKIAVMAQAKTSIGAGTNRRDLADAIATGIIGNSDCTDKLDGMQIKDKAALGSWGPPTQGRLASLLDSVMWWKEGAFLSVFARVVHDDLNSAIARGKGLWVENQVGDRWQLSGDETLSLSPRSLEIGRKAVQASEDNLVDAAKVKSPGFPSLPWTSALDDAFLARAHDNVWKFVPSPTKTSLAGEGPQSGKQQIDTAIAKGTNATDPDTIKAIVALSIAQFDTALNELQKNDLIRPDPTPAPEDRPTNPPQWWDQGGDPFPHENF